MKKENLNLFEAFAGIGSQLTALNNIGLKINPIGISEWDIFALNSYFYINGFLTKDTNINDYEDFIKYFKNNDYSTNSKTINQRLKQEAILNKYIYKNILKNIYFINKNKINIYPNIEKIRGEDIINLKIDIFTYSFPCQDLSSAGTRKGFKDNKGENTRSGLLYEIQRILSEAFKISKINKEASLPTFLLLENVGTLFSKKYINEYLKWKNMLKKFGYSTFDGILNSKDYGIPQFRRRAFAISILNYQGKLNYYSNKNFDPNNFDLDLLKSIIEKYSKHKKKLNKNKIKMEDVIKNDELNDYYIKEIMKAIPNHTKSRDNMWERERKLLSWNEDMNIDPKFEKYSRTLTTKQDRWNNAGMVQLSNEIKSKIYEKEKKWERLEYRLITRKEALLFMGFKEAQINNLLNNSNPSITKVWHQAGNSIVVNVLEVIFELFIKRRI